MQYRTKNETTKINLKLNNKLCCDIRVNKKNYRRLNWLIKKLSSLFSYSKTEIKICFSVKNIILYMIVILFINLFISLISSYKYDYCLSLPSNSTQSGQESSITKKHQEQQEHQHRRLSRSNMIMPRQTHQIESQRYTLIELKSNHKLTKRVTTLSYLYKSITISIKCCTLTINIAEE